MLSNFGFHNFSKLQGRFKLKFSELILWIVDYEILWSTAVRKYALSSVFLNLNLKQKN